MKLAILPKNKATGICGAQSNSVRSKNLYFFLAGKNPNTYHLHQLLHHGMPYHPHAIFKNRKDLEAEGENHKI